VLCIVPFGYAARPVGRGKKQRKPFTPVVNRNRVGQPFRLATPYRRTMRPVIPSPWGGEGGSEVEARKSQRMPNSKLRSLHTVAIAGHQHMRRLW